MNEHRLSLSLLTHTNTTKIKSVCEKKRRGGNEVVKIQKQEIYKLELMKYTMFTATYYQPHHLESLTINWYNHSDYAYG